MNQIILYDLRLRQQFQGHCHFFTWFCWFVAKKLENNHKELTPVPNVTNVLIP